MRARRGGESATGSSWGAQWAAMAGFQALTCSQREASSARSLRWVCPPQPLHAPASRVQYPGPPTLICPRESVESRVPSARGAAHNRPATSSRSAGGGCGATGASSGTYTSQPGGLLGSPATRCAAPSGARLKGARAQRGRARAGQGAPPPREKPGLGLAPNIPLAAGIQPA